MPKGMPRTREVYVSPAGLFGRRNIRAMMGGPTISNIDPISRDRARMVLGDRVLGKMESKADASGTLQSSYAGGWDAVDAEWRATSQRIRAGGKPKKKPK